MRAPVVTAAAALLLGAAVVAVVAAAPLRGQAPPPADALEVMSPEEVAELHANVTRARELQGTGGNVLVVGECGLPRARARGRLCLRAWGRAGARLGVSSPRAGGWW